jgi:uncharacterized glyoxalase superfamily protein PhnB
MHDQLSDRLSQFSVFRGQRNQPGVILTCMTTPAKSCPSTVIPGMRYRNALSAIEWLVRAFGFERQAVYLGSDNTTVMHAQLTFGNGMIMIGSVPKDVDKSNPYSGLMIQPDEAGGRETKSISLIVDDADAVCDRAKAAGATIVFDIEDKPYGGRAFTCRDPEGHLWNIGTYNPWA